MKILHLSDLHIGKRVNEQSMIEDQAYILDEILRITNDKAPNAIVIAGDIYDKSVPSAEAVSLFDDFIVKLSKTRIPVLIISGNHDSAERLAFASELIERAGIYISPVYNGEIKPVTLSDEHGEVRFYLLPFIKPLNVKRFFEGEEIGSYTDALRVAISSMNIDTSVRNVLVCHQFVTGATRSESEDISVGGTDNVDAGVLKDFDFVALGHIHGPQNIGSEKIHYCGTPLKYSFSEVNHKKGVSLITLGKKGELSIERVPLVPLRDMREIKGKYDELMRRDYYESTTLQSDYVHIILTDEDDVPNAINKLRTVYKNILRLSYDNKRTRALSHIEGAPEVEGRTPYELFADFYKEQNGDELSAEQDAFVRDLIEKIWEDKR